VSAAEMHPGRCSWHGGWADDVVLVTAHEGGSGPGGGAHGCLPCVRTLVGRGDVSDWLREQVAAMEERAARTEGAAS
jgi:hypothetical protein